MSKKYAVIDTTNHGLQHGATGIVYSTSSALPTGITTGQLVSVSTNPLNDPEIISGVNALEQMGILSVGRAAEVLA